MKTLTHEIILGNIKPRLKIGTVVLLRGECTYVGGMERGVEISSPARAALALMTGEVSCLEMSTSLDLPISEIAQLVAELDQAAFLDTEPAKIAVHTRFHSPNSNRASYEGDDSNDGAFQQMKIKLLPELSFTTWLAGIRDGGVGLMGARREREVSIVGDSRIACLLYGILLASGVSMTALISNKDHRTITEDLLCAGFLRPSDIGLSLSARAAECARELSLFPIHKSGVGADKSGQKLAIVVGNPPADQIQKWMSEGVPHLLIGGPDAASLTVGPLVIPGRTPCARCVAITQEEGNEIWRDIVWQKITAEPVEVPVAVSHHVAGLVALELLRFMDEGQSALIGSSVRIDFHNPSRSERRVFTRHPACGCNW